MGPKIVSQANGHKSYQEWENQREGKLKLRGFRSWDKNLR